MNAPVVRLRDARFGYRGSVAAHVELSIASREVVALLGPNGSGKSTVVKGMLGVADCYGGEVEWFGRPRAKFTERWRVGYVPQRQLAASPVPATVRELVASGRLARRGILRRSSAADRAAIDAALDAVGLSAQRKVPVGQLSGGQQRRALVARGLAAEAEVLVLDEPFAGVDRDSQAAIADVLSSLCVAGTTLIVVLHELGPLEPWITRAVCLDAGAVIYDGAPERRPADHEGVAGSHDPHGGEQPVARLGLFAK